MLTHKTKMTNAKYDISIDGHCEYEDVSMKLTIMTVNLLRLSDK